MLDGIRKGIGAKAATILVAAAVVIIASVGSPGTEAAPDAASLPEGYPTRYDLRESGTITPVKKQDPWGSCWAFGAVAAAESSILSESGRTYDDTGLDLSERHLAWYALLPIQEEDDPSQVGEGVHSVTYEETGDASVLFDNGGNGTYASTLLASGAGPVSESDFPYRGEAGALEADWLESNRDKWVDEAVAEWKKRLPLDDGTLRSMAEDKYDGAFAKARQSDCPAREDDWSIPAVDDDGIPNRFRNSGYLLRDGNILPEYAMRGERDVSGTRPYKGINEEGFRAIKDELMAGRAVSVAFHADSSRPGQEGDPTYINLDTWSHYTYEDAPINHAVTIVGWDDSYPAESFWHEVYAKDEGGRNVVDEERTALTTPPGDGAWLVRNSWGSESDAIEGGLVRADGSTEDANRGEWGIVEDGEHTGYFWLSYHDKTIQMAETLSFDDDYEGAELVVSQHDYLPASDFLDLTEFDGELSQANVFVTEDDELLEGVSIRTASPGQSVDFEAYLLADDADDPEDGRLVADMPDIRFDWAGVHRVDLPEPVRLASGQRFSVKATVRDDRIADGHVAYVLSVARGLSKTHMEYMEERHSAVLELTGGGSDTYSVAVVNPGESFVRRDGKWVDWRDWLDGEEGRDALAETDPNTGERIEGAWVADNLPIKAYGTRI